jgi:anti-anti-sigma factor
MDSHREHAANLHHAQSFFGPPSSVSDHRSGDVSILDVSGPLTGSEAVEAFRGRVRKLLDEGVTKFAINLAEVGDIDSYGLGGLAAAYNWVAAAGGQIDFFGARPWVRRTLNRLRLDSVLAVFKDKRNALQAFAAVPNHAGTQPRAQTQR